MSARIVATPKLAVTVAAAFCGVALLAFTPAATADDACVDLPPAQQAVANTWKQSTAQLVAGSISANAPPLSVSKRTHVSLLPARNIPVLTTSRPREKRTSDHAGLLRIQVQTTGMYVIGSASKIWIELMSDAARDPLPTEDIDRSLRCIGIHKALSYRLDADRTYVLQISESAEAQVDMVVQELVAAKASTK